jgi:hypothetical protein
MLCGVDSAMPCCAVLSRFLPLMCPVQVTASLASFWADAYVQVKKEMKGRYPRHPWPDDPANATPTRLTNKQLAAAGGAAAAAGDGVGGSSDSQPAKLQAVNKKKRK